MQLKEPVLKALESAVPVSNVFLFSACLIRIFFVPCHRFSVMSA